MSNGCMRTKIRIIIETVVLLGILCACFDDDLPRIVPYTPVHIEASLAEPQFAPLYIDGTAVLIPGHGYRGHGVIIYRHIGQVCAYDATCSNCLQATGAATAVELGGSADGFCVCSVCGARYMLLSGWAEGFKYPLQAYNAQITGDNYVRVNN